MAKKRTTLVMASLPPMMLLDSDRPRVMEITVRGRRGRGIVVILQALVPNQIVHFDSIIGHQAISTTRSITFRLVPQRRTKKKCDG